MKKGLCAIGEALIDFIPEEKGCRLKMSGIFNELRAERLPMLPVRAPSSADYHE